MLNTRLHPSEILRRTEWLNTYERACAWVALEDDNGSDERLRVDVLHAMLTVCLTADTFGREQGEVAHDVVLLRRREDRYVAAQRVTTVQRARTLAGRTR